MSTFSKVSGMAKLAAILIHDLGKKSATAR